MINNCESCGPILALVYPKDGTHYCASCFQAEGWKLPYIEDRIRMPAQRVKEKLLGLELNEAEAYMLIQEISARTR